MQFPAQLEREPNHHSRGVSGPGPLGMTSNGLHGSGSPCVGQNILRSHRHHAPSVFTTDEGDQLRRNACEARPTSRGGLMTSPSNAVGFPHTVGVLTWPHRVSGLTLTALATLEPAHVEIASSLHRSLLDVTRPQHAEPGTLVQDGVRTGLADGMARLRGTAARSHKASWPSLMCKLASTRGSLESLETSGHPAAQL